MTVDTGANINMSDDQSQQYRSMGVQSFFYPYASQTAFNPLSGVQTAYPYSDSASAASYFFSNGALDNAVFGRYTTGGTGVYYSQYEFALRVGTAGRFAVWQGFETTTAWSSSTTYIIGAVVLYSGTSYKALQTTTNNQPDISPTYWAATAKTERLRIDENGNIYQVSPKLIGYGAGSGGAVTQLSTRTTPVTINTPAGTITMFTAAGSATAATVVVNNNLVVATDTIILSVRGATNTYLTSVSNVGAGTFSITFYTTGGTASDTPLINFSIIHAVTA
jgi:hypothetical protein